MLSKLSLSMTEKTGSMHLYYLEKTLNVRGAVLYVDHFIRMRSNDVMMNYDFDDDDDDDDDDE